MVPSSPIWAPISAVTAKRSRKRAPCCSSRSFSSSGESVNSTCTPRSKRGACPFSGRENFSPPFMLLLQFVDDVVDGRVALIGAFTHAALAAFRLFDLEIDARVVLH